MLGAVAVLQQLAVRAWKHAQQRAQQDMQVVEQAAVQGLGAAADKLANVAKPVDGTDQLPGYAFVQVCWEVSGLMHIGPLPAALQGAWQPHMCCKL